MKNCSLRLAVLVTTAMLAISAAASANDMIYDGQTNVNGAFNSKPETHSYTIMIPPHREVHVNFNGLYTYYNVVAGKKLPLAVPAECEEMTLLWRDRRDFFNTISGINDELDSAWGVLDGSPRGACMDDSEAEVYRQRWDRYFVSFSTHGTSLPIPSPESSDPRDNTVIFKNPSSSNMMIDFTMSNNGAKSFPLPMAYYVQLSWPTP